MPELTNEQRLLVLERLQAAQTVGANAAQQMVAAAEDLAEANNIIEECKKLLGEGR